MSSSMTAIEPQDRKDYLSAASALLAQTIVMDAHIDTVQRVLNMGADLGTRRPCG